MSVVLTGEAPPVQPALVRPKRPLGLTIICILWLIGGIFNLYAGISTVSLDLEVLPYLGHPALDPWFNFGIPAELALGAFQVILGAVQLVTIFGLWTGKPWSYRLALIIPILVAAGWWASVALYWSAPADLKLFSLSDIVSPIMSLVWVVVFWAYLRRPHVKEYLRVK